MTQAVPLFVVDREGVAEGARGAGEAEDLVLPRGDAEHGAVARLGVGAAGGLDDLAAKALHDGLGGGGLELGDVELGQRVDGIAVLRGRRVRTVAQRREARRAAAVVEEDEIAGELPLLAGVRVRVAVAVVRGDDAERAALGEPTVGVDLPKLARRVARDEDLLVGSITPLGAKVRP